MSDDGFAYSARKTFANAATFAVGKIFSAIATLFWLGLVVRLLGVGEYARYVAVVAALETGVVIAAVGLDWVVVRYVPELYVKRDFLSLRSFIVRAALMRVLAAGVLACLGLFVGYFIGLPASSRINSVAIYAVPLATLLISESLLRLLRDNVLESLGAQRFTQMGVLLRTVLLIGFVLLANAVSGATDALTVLRLELLASLVTLIFAFCALILVLRRVTAGDMGVSTDRCEGQFPPSFRKSLGLGLHNYVSTLVSYAVSTQVLVLVASGFSSPGTVASFGFVCRLFDIARGYVPALMLMGVLRPRFVGIYAATGDFARVATEAQMASRLSLLTVAPIASIVFLYGNDILSLLSGGAVQTGGVALAILVATLLLRVHRQISVVLANCVDLSSVLFRISICGLLGWMGAWWFFSIGKPLVGAVSLVIVDEVVWVVLMALALSRQGFSWSSGLSQVGLALIATIPCAAISWWIVSRLLQMSSGDPFAIALGSIIVLVVYIPASWLVNLLRSSDIAMIRNLSTRRTSRSV